MDLPAYLKVIIWIDIRVCLPFTFLLLTLCCLVRLDHVPVSYYMNLLLSNLIQLIILIAYPSLHWRYFSAAYIYGCCAMASLCFRMMIALERCISISCLSSSCITQTKGFVIVSVLVWLFSMFGLLFIAVHQELSYLFFALLPTPVLPACLAVTLKSICGNMSVPAEEKRRTVGILVVLLINYTMAGFPMVFWFIYSYFRNNVRSYKPSFKIPDIILTLFLLGYFFDLLLFVVMCKGLIDKLLIRLCCCRMENTEGTDGSRSSA